MILTKLCLVALASCAWGHMEMIEPYALRSKYDPANKQSGQIDYSMTSPLLADGSNFPCKGYQNDRPIRTVATYKAGSNYTMKLAGSATHGGGSCQLSLSYDNAKTFHVIKSMIGGCPLQDSYDFQIPSSAPSGTALFSWTWVNLIGNREYYMNCAEVEIQGGSGATNHRRHLNRHRRPVRDASATGSFNNLPYIWKANLPNENTCKTQENTQVVYPHPGPDVVYGSGVTASNPLTSGSCDSSSPPGPTYKDLPTTGATSEGSSYGSGGDSSGASFSSSSAAANPSTASGASPAKGSPFGGGGSSACSGGAGGSSPSQAQAPAPTESNAGSPSGQNGSSANSGGSCSGSGLMCLRGGQGFALCSNGNWVDMGSVAPGTVCSNGVIGFPS